MKTFDVENWKKQFKFLPLGVRCNNIGCIRSASPWQGLKGDYHGYCCFVSYEYGVRALTMLLMRYLYHNRLFDVQSMLSYYAPSSDGNNPHVYAAYVTNICGVKKLSNNIALVRIQLPLVVHAIATMENGSEYVFLSNNEDYRSYIFDLVSKYIDEYLDQVVYPKKGKVFTL